MEQREFPLLGQVKRALPVGVHRHAMSELATCETFGEAMRLAQIHSHTKAYEIARMCGVRKSLVSAWQSDTRMPNPRQLALYMSVTGSAAPLQWLCAASGGEFHFDPLKVAARLIHVQADQMERAA